MPRLWRYQPVFDEWTTHRVLHPDAAVVSTLGTVDGFEWFVATDDYVPVHDLLTFEEVTPTEEVQASLLAESPHAQLLTRRMQEGPPRYSADDEARLRLFIGLIPGLEAHIQEGRAWDK